MRISEKYILFWETCFSNFHTCKIVYDDISFFSSEHLFMYLKAKVFEDKDIAMQITKVGTPKEAKALGRKVKNFDDERWKSVREEYMEIAVYEKFKQNPSLAKELMYEDYFGKQFVEASPLDKIWGIGLYWEDKLCDDVSNWKGLNLLGKTLDRVRMRLLNEEAALRVKRDKPEVCMLCNSSNVVPIMYGEPSPEALFEAYEGKVILGGCIIIEPAPIWGCIDCGVEYFNEDSTEIYDPSEDLREEYARLKEEYTRLFEEREHMINFSSNTLSAIFIEKIGKLQFEILALQTEVKAAKMKVEMIQAAKNRDEDVCEERIDLIIKGKLEHYYKRVEELAKEAEYAKKHLEAPLLSEEIVKELKSIYAFFVKRLHPDINPNYTEEDKELFLKIQAAYKMLDIAYLREALLAYNKGNTNVKDNAMSLAEMIDRIKENIDKLETKIEELRNTFPFIYEENLKNPEWIASEREIGEKKIAGLRDELQAYKLHIATLLGKGSMGSC